MCECRSLCGAGVLDARFQTGIEHAALCRLARCGLVRARRRATRQQSLDPPALALYRSATPKISRAGGFVRSRMAKESESLQEKYAPKNSCFGCGPSNPDGLHVRSFPKNGEVVAQWKPEKKYEAFDGVLNGGIIGTLLDCHCNWTAAY